MRALRAAIAVAVSAAALAGCEPNPYCLNCGAGGNGDAGDGGGGGGDLLTDDAGPDLLAVDLTLPPDLVLPASIDMPPDLTACAPTQLQSDPHNCGTCGHECIFINAAGLCMQGKCVIGACQPGFVDLDKNAANGCEYGCIASNQKVCNGKDNFCDGKINEGFDLMTDINNCGTCGNACNFPNTSVACVAGKCSVTMCKPGFADVDKNPFDGCEYMCPVFPTKPETCNGVDDDCNGLIDDKPTDVGGTCDDYCPAIAPCVAGKTCSFKLSTCAGKCCGACTEGMQVCAGGGKLCQAGLGAKLEVCNGIDDDCDGQIDNGFDLNTDPMNCGACGTACSVPNAIAGCAGGKCSITSCKPGFGDIDKNPANGCEYTCPVYPPTGEVCNGKDDDCNGLVDDALTTPMNFCIQTSICAGSKPSCQGAKGFVCNYAATNTHIEVDSNGNLLITELACDGFDGNCNGQVDESFANLGKTCGAGTGRCAGTSRFVCSADTKTTTCPAMANPNAAVDELCNGIDDNCDGQTDERTPKGSPVCFNGGQHTCLGWVDPMVKVGATWVYQYEASRPDATSTTVGASQVRSCSNAGVLPWASVAWQQAHDACAAVLDSTGAPMRLCHDTEWSNACSLGSNGTVWSYASNSSVYQPMVCNGIDHASGTALATGALASCYANQGAGKLFDMSGNVAEWTDKQVASGGKTYYKTRGGAYNSYSGGLSCNFDFTLEVPTYQFSTLGFRCCSDNAP